jgi:hypothetical protein
MKSNNMNLSEPYNTWLTKHIGAMIDPNLRYVLRVSAATSQGETTLDLGLDLSWFILIQVEDEDAKKLEIVLELLKNPEFTEQFKATLRIPQTKRFFEEFLLYNYYFLDGLKSYIDFTILNVPIDFISQALFIKLSDQPDTEGVDDDRIKIVKLVLDTGFVLTGDYPINSVGFAVRKVLMMQKVPERFQLARRMLGVGFQLFTNTPASNSELAVELINNRADADCLEIIKNNAAAFKEINLSVAGSSSGSNLADYFYWVKEDMLAVNFIRETIGLDISP